MKISQRGTIVEMLSINNYTVEIDGQCCPITLPVVPKGQVDEGILHEIAASVIGAPVIVFDNTIRFYRSGVLYDMTVNLMMSGLVKPMEVKEAK